MTCRPAPRPIAPDARQVLCDLIAARFSCRAFKPDPVPDGDIAQMLRMSQGAASWCNSQPWQVIVTKGAATDRFREALYKHASDSGWASGPDRPETPDFAFPLKYEGVYKQRQRETGWALYSSVGVAHGDREASGRQALENFRLFGAPHVMIITTEQNLGVYGAIDCGSYLANLLLAAQSFGISTIAQAALAGCAPFVRDYFNIPATRQVVCGVSFGYADDSHPANGFRTTRAPLEDVVTFVE